MQTDTQAELATATQVGDITDKQVRAFLLSIAERLAQFIPDNGLLHVCAELNLFPGGRDEIKWTTYADGGNHQTATRLEDAFNMQVQAMNPKFLAEAKRREAAALIEAANKLDPKSNEPAQ